MMILNNYIDHQFIAPNKALAPFIGQYFIIAMKAETSLDKLEYSVPPRAHSVLIIKQNTTSGTYQVLVVGPHLHHLKVVVERNEKWCIAELNAGAALSLFNVPISKLKHQSVDLAQSAPHFTHNIEQRFLKGFDTHELDKILLSLQPTLKVPTMVTQAIDQLRNLENPPKVAEVAHALGISIRKLQREFAKWVGVSPKQFQNISRLRSSLNLASEEKQSWTRIALKSGYFDQPHLNKNLGNVLELKPSQITSQKPT